MNTSALVYKEIIATGFITGLKRRIVEHLGTKGPSTTHEIADVYKIPRDSISPRLPELQRANIVKVMGFRPCDVNGRLKEVWGLTGFIPTCPARPRVARKFYIVGTHAFKRQENAIACSEETGEPVIPVVERFEKKGRK